MILSIDVSHRLGLINLELPDGRNLSRHSGRPREHMEFIQTALAELQSESGLSWNSLSRMAVTLGPGSFTGLRVGLSAAKGLIFSTDIPLLPLSSLAVPAEAANEAMPRAIFRRARAMELWTAFFPPGEHAPRDLGLRTRAEALLWRDTLAQDWPELTCFGEDAGEGPALDLLPEPSPAEQLAALGRLAKRGGREYRGEEIDTVLPDYMAEASITLPGGRKP